MLSILLLLLTVSVFIIRVVSLQPFKFRDGKEWEDGGGV